jgi:hypothetical protein
VWSRKQTQRDGNRDIPFSLTINSPLLGITKYQSPFTIHHSTNVWCGGRHWAGGGVPTPLGVLFGVSYPPLLLHSPALLHDKSIVGLIRFASKAPGLLHLRTFTSIFALLFARSTHTRVCLSSTPLNLNYIYLFLCFKTI